MTTAVDLAKARLEELQAERATIMAQIDPLDAQRNALEEQIGPLIQQQNELADQKRAIITNSGLFELDMEIARMARIAGAKSMNE